MVIGFMGIGPLEVVIVCIIGFFLLAVPIGVVLLILYLVRGRSSDRVAQLEAENRHLREQLGQRQEDSDET